MLKDWHISLTVGLAILVAITLPILVTILLLDWLDHYPHGDPIHLVAGLFFLTISAIPVAIFIIKMVRQHKKEEG